ncbi:P-loop containing nucleoside triphosphate hydrolase protein [Gigaspora rosea]|uniref:P-loop containing nucleoside triphosphate hydrolase protein n=1 Tax=Gigaspora rosea TaxID=44941 RepID=A0A397UMA9_9GLOM|nr:P-loop containing nucleoside triphosphate hydrolase protein [Gigaspora rosea]
MQPTNVALSVTHPNVTIYGGNRANFLSSWFFLWIFRLLKISRKHNLGYENLTLQVSEKAQIVGDRLEGFWKVETDTKKTSKPSICRALIKSFGAPYALLGLYKLFAAAFMFVGYYYLINQLIIFIEVQNDPNQMNTSEHIYAVCFFGCALAFSIFNNQVTSESTRIGVQVRAALMVLVYRKSLRLGTIGGGIGDVVKLVSNDCNKVAEACVNLHFLWSSAVEIIVMIILVWIQLSLAALPALVILLILFPVQYKLGRLTSNIYNSISNITSSRIHLMSEILTAIKVIKFYAWESYFRERVGKVRNKEWTQMITGLVLKVWTFCVVFGAPILAMLGCLCVKLVAYQYPDNVLKPNTMFTVLALFYTVRYPLMMLPVAVRTTLGALDSFKRLNEFLLKSELEPLEEESSPINDDQKIRVFIHDADFSYEGTTRPALKFLNMTLRQGEIIAIVGDVGAGKSSILAAILGQIRKENGVRKIRGSISYVPHDAWLLNDTLKENILFGNECDEERYQEVIQVCALRKDLEWLSNSDMTEIGERGVNLSLGQRQRVSLARAVYSNADIVLLDDPLSVMDPVIGKHIFHECIRKYLKKKAIVFVTNQLQFLSECDHIIVMKNGECIEEGTYSELIEKDVSLASLINDYVEIEDPDQIDELINEIRLEPVSDDDDKNFDDFNILVTDYSRETNIINNSPISLNRTLSNTEANEHTISRIIESNKHTSQDINERTIAKMIERNSLSALSGAGKTRVMGPKVNREMNVTAFAVEKNQLTIHSLNERDGIPPINIVSETKKKEFKAGFSVYLDYFRKSTGLGLTLLMMSLFFLMTAIRIFSDWWLIKLVETDQDADFGYLLGVYGALVGAVLIGIFARGVFYAWAIMRKSESLHDRTFLKIMRAPMSYFDGTPLGRILNIFAKHQYLVDDVLSDNALQFLTNVPLVIGTIVFVIVLIPYTATSAAVLVFLTWLIIHISRDVEERFKMLDANSKPPIFAHLSASLEGLASIRSYKVEKRFDNLNIEKVDANNKALFTLMQVKSWQSLYIDIMASIFIYTTALFVILLHHSDSVSPAVAGLAIVIASQLLIFGQSTIRSGRDIAAIMESVQQLLYFRQNIPSEAPNIIEGKRPPSDWGERGEIKFKNVVLRYNRFGVAVLKNISFHIKPREKIGIIGKTGSGKSTLLVSLLRIVELADGEILIDDLDIKTIGLRDLRSKIAIIPQEPVIFAGTIKSNLDPFNKCSEDEIWEALEAAHLDEKVRSMPDKLATVVLESGKKFSLGQRQLFCIARALLKKTNILVLDEATSAVDAATDRLIQDTIKKHFADHTVLTIAHRLNTIMDADRILCLDEGHVAEFDSLDKLLRNQNGFFYQLVAHSGPDAVQRLKEKIGIHDESSSSKNVDNHTNSPNSSTVNIDNNINQQTSTHVHHMPQSLGGVFEPSPPSATSTSQP